MSFPSRSRPFAIRLYIESAHGTNKLYHNPIQLYYSAVAMERNESTPDTRAAVAGGIQVIARAASILRVLKDDNEGLSLGQIAGRVDLARSTVQRIVNALITERLVIAMPNGGGFRLGPEIQALAAGGQDIANEIQPYLVQLSQATGETVDLTAFRDDHVVFIGQMVGTHRLRAVATVGESFPLTTTANGKACLALLDDETVEILATRELRAGGRGMRALGQFMNQIARVRTQGYAVDQDEHTDGISAVGAAFATPDGQIYSVSIPVPSHRFDRIKSDIIERLLASVGELKAHYGVSLAG